MSKHRTGKTAKIYVFLFNFLRRLYFQLFYVFETLILLHDLAITINYLMLFISVGSIFFSLLAKCAKFPYAIGAKNSLFFSKKKKINQEKLLHTQRTHEAQIQFVISKNTEKKIAFLKYVFLRCRSKIDASNEILGWKKEAHQTKNQSKIV